MAEAIKQGYGNRRINPDKKLSLYDTLGRKMYSPNEAKNEDLKDTAEREVPTDAETKDRIARMREYLYRAYKPFSTESGKPIEREDIPDIIPVDTPGANSGYVYNRDPRNRIYLRSRVNPDSPQDRSTAFHETGHVLSGIKDVPYRPTKDYRFGSDDNVKATEWSYYPTHPYGEKVEIDPRTGETDKPPLEPFYLANALSEKEDRTTKDALSGIGPHDTTALLLGNQLNKEFDDRDRSVGQALYETFIHRRMPKPSEYYNAREVRKRMKEHNYGLLEKKNQESSDRIDKEISERHKRRKGYSKDKQDKEDKKINEVIKSYVDKNR
jgi:hypothetical protein